MKVTLVPGLAALKVLPASVKAAVNEDAANTVTDPATVFVAPAVGEAGAEVELDLLEDEPQEAATIARPAKRARVVWEAREITL